MKEIEHFEHMRILTALVRSTDRGERRHELCTGWSGTSAHGSPISFHVLQRSYCRLHKTFRTLAIIRQLGQLLEVEDLLASSSSIISWKSNLLKYSSS